MIAWLLIGAVGLAFAAIAYAITADVSELFYSGRRIRRLDEEIERRAIAERRLREAARRG